jgi:hypothetical protein
MMLKLSSMRHNKEYRNSLPKHFVCLKRADVILLTLLIYHL